MTQLDFTDDPCLSMLNSRSIATWEQIIFGGREGLIWVSPEIEVLTGYSAREYGTDVRFFYEVLLHPADRGVVEEANRRSLESDTYSAHYRIETQAGEERWITDLAQRLTTDEDRWVGFSVACECPPAIEAARLTPTESVLLQALERSAGEVARYEDLVTIVWGCPQAVRTSMLRTAIMRLRRKVAPEGRTITAVPGVGYRLTRHEAHGR